MALTINTNVASLNAQRQLVNSGKDLDQASERLASGRRVNNAADDAAGLAIANRLTSQIRGLDQAIRNANDGISLIQTAEGALNETTNILQRIRELSIQSSNGIYSDADRSTLDAEVQQLKEELDRIATSTTFNGQPILDGSLGSVTLQAGSEAADTIDLEIAAVDTKALGGQNTGDVIGSAVAGANAAAVLTTLQTITDATNETLTVNQQSVGNLSLATNVGDALATINANVSGVEATAFVEMVATNAGNGIVRGTEIVTVTLDLQDGSQNILQIRNTGSLKEFAERINEVNGDFLNASINDDGRLVLQSDAAAFVALTSTAANATAISATGLVTADLTQALQLSFEATADDVTAVNIAIGSTIDDGTLGLNARTAGDITGLAIGNTGSLDLDAGALEVNGVEIGVITNTLGAGANNNATTIADAINLLSGEHGVVATAAGAVLSLNSISGDEIQVLQNSTIALADTGLINTNISESQGDTVSSIAIGTAVGARNALNVVDVALEQINAIRADLGAINNRLDFTISNLSNVVENTSASRSRILDADFAAESAALSRAQVLQQASQAILAQANARPQQVLQLLQN